LRVGGQRQRALLALLLLRANEVVSSDLLIDELFGSEASERAVNALQAAVSRLRRSLEGRDGVRVVVTRAPGYALDVAPDQVDLARFEQLFAQGREMLAGGDPRRASESLREALRLWRGEPLADLGSHEFVERERRRLAELRLAAVMERIDADLALGLQAELVAELEALVDEHPYSERLRAQLMLALYRSGRQADALESYQEARRVLVDELGIEPRSELRDLQQAILNQDPSLTVPGKQKPWPEIGLPAAANPLMGRRTELRKLGDLLRGHARLVTLTGAGGSGKTRLALEVATTLSKEFEENVAFVSLASLRQPEQLPATIASALGLELGPDDASPLETLTRSLREQAALIVLDNFEQLLEAAPLLAELLARCWHLKLLVTSRGSLHLSGEREFPLDPLPPKDAIELITDRVRAVRPEFACDDVVLAEICARLDCLPLALELAAPHMRLLSPEQLLARIEHRLELLRGGPRDLAARQQTLQATIEWSYELLDHEEKQLFACLAVFSGGCTLEAAERVCEATLDRLESLVDKNLVTRGEMAGETRFSMLETIREYALERLEVENAVEGACQAYADYYLAFAEEQVADVDQGRLGALLALERDLDNFLSAFAWSQSPLPVPVPVDDGACEHLAGETIPSLVLDSSHGPVDLADLATGRLVLYVYPGTTKPGRPPLPGLYALPSGRGCTSESRAFRDHSGELAALGASVAGLSVQILDEQLEFADRAQMPFPLIADPGRELEVELGLPTFEVAGRTLYRRVTLIAEQGRVVKIFYPVFPPERNAREVIDWLRR
jgi:predicted ATPase/DNA-binding SARP family transcriptional activator/peroxiredoxin